MTIQTRRTRALGLAEKTILGVIAGGAAAIGVVELVLLVGHVAGLASNASVVMTGMPVTDARASVISDTTPLVSSAIYETVALSIEGLPAAARGYLIAAVILDTLVSIGISVVVAWLCIRVFVNRPFVRSATWGIGAVAVLVFVGGLGSSLFTGIAQAEAVSYLGLGAAEGLSPDFAASVDLAPLGWALALIVVAGAFELGQRMQRDTERLV